MYFTKDTVANAVRATSDDGETTADFSMDAVRVAQVENDPITTAFGTDRFYVFDSVVARPIEQEYELDGERYTFKKTEDALKQAAWSMDNAYFPITHPSSGVVQDFDQVHGFYRKPKYVEDYDEDGDASVATLYVPTNDDTALSWLKTFTDVSVGFYNDLQWETDDESVDAYQTNMLYDHVAGVQNGRCSDDDGCGIMMDTSDTDDAVVPSMATALDCACECDDSVTVTEASSVSPSELAEEDTTSGCSDGPCSCGEHTEQPSATNSDTETTIQSTMTENESDDVDINLDSFVESMSLDAIAEKNDDVKEVVEDRTDATDRVDVLEDKVETLEAEKASLTEDLAEYREAEKSEMVDAILDSTGAWEREALMDESVEELERRKQIVEDTASSPSTPDEDSTETDEPTTDSSADEEGRTVSNEHRTWA